MKTEIFDREALADDFHRNRPIPFWSWNNKLDPAELVRQIGEMKKAGIGGFIMHARTGLLTEYLSEDWFECIGVCLKEARRLNMEAWVYDENGWPSGFAGGLLLKNPENLARYLSYSVKSEFDPEAYCVYVERDGGFVLVESGEKAGEFHCVYRHSSPANTDILNPDVVTQFIKCTYEPYFERFGDRFGKEFAGFFTDEPQYYRWATPFTKFAPEEFKERYGEDIRNGLIWLFQQNERGYDFRLKYYKMLNDLYTTNFYKRLCDWCVEHGTQFTGHSVEEGMLTMQMWGGAGVMPSYEYETVPGIDCLGRGQPGPLASKQVGSVSAQLERPQVLTETFGCSGFDATPRELKFIGECQFVGGVNLMCLHLMNYSMQGQGKLDHPPTFSEHMTWWKDFKDFNDYFGKLGYLIESTRDAAKTLVVHPLHNVYLDYQRDNCSLSERFDAKLWELEQQLMAHHVDWHFADEHLLSRYGSVETGRAKLGSCVYDSVVLPYCETIDESTRAFLEAYFKAGGKIFAPFGLPELVDGKRAELGFTADAGLTFDKLARSLPEALRIKGAPMYNCRIGRDANGRTFEFVYVVNGSDGDVEIEVGESFEVVDLLAAKTSPAPKCIRLERTESVVLVRDAESAPASFAEVPAFGTERDVVSAFRAVSGTENNLTLDRVRASIGGGAFGEPRFVYELKDSLIRSDFKGRLQVKYSFLADDLCACKLLCEKQKWISIAVNGHELCPAVSAFDFNFLEADLTKYVRVGENEISFEIDYYQSPIVRYALFDPEATESLRNCLVYDTEVESIYIRGDFELSEDLHLKKKNRAVSLSEIQNQGYPMFAGEMVFEGEVHFETEIAEFRADGRFMTADIEIDGCSAGKFVLSDRVKVRAEAGKSHRVTIRLCSSLRNMFGPFHMLEVDPIGVSPSNFTYLGAWKDGKADGFYSGYHSVKFGLDHLFVRFQEER